MESVRKLEKYEEDIKLEEFRPYEKAHGFLNNLRQDFDSIQKKNKGEFLTVTEYVKQHRI